MCKEHVLTKIRENDRVMKEARERAATAENVVQRILHYYSYAEHKKSPKMRFTIKEYNHALSLLSDEEKAKLESWLDLNGGLDKYVVVGHNG
jgi:flagellar motility protein MotE (MotC chaperone)